MLKRCKDLNDSVNSLLLHMAPSYGIELCLFSPEDVNLEKNMVNGLFIENGKQVRRIVPIPTIVDNKTKPPHSYKQMVKFFKTLRERVYFTRNPIYFAKFGQFKRISTFLGNTEFGDMVIPTLLVEKDIDIMQLFDKLGNHIILKPENSSRGRGIFGIERRDNEFSVIKDDDKATMMSSSLLKSYIDGFSSSTGYIAQKRVHSFTTSGHPFDIRILIQRRNKDSHAYVMYPRIGGGKILSNLATGGRTMPIHTFLEENFGKMSAEVKSALESIAMIFPKYYQIFLNDPFFDLGFDIGIEKRNDSFKLWLFEVNYMPQFAFNNYAQLHMEIARASLECYRYLYNSLND